MEAVTYSGMAQRPAVKGAAVKGAAPGHHGTRATAKSSGNGHCSQLAVEEEAAAAAKAPEEEVAAMKKAAEEEAAAATRAAEDDISPVISGGTVIPFSSRWVHTRIVKGPRNPKKPFASAHICSVREPEGDRDAEKLRERAGHLARSPVRQAMVSPYVANRAWSCLFGVGARTSEGAEAGDEGIRSVAARAGGGDSTGDGGSPSGGAGAGISMLLAPPPLL